MRETYDYTASIALYQAVKRHCPNANVTHHDYGPTSFAIWVNAKTSPPFEMPFLLSMEAPEDGDNEWTYDAGNQRCGHMVSGPLEEWKAALTAWERHNRVKVTA